MNRYCARHRTMRTAGAMAAMIISLPACRSGAQRPPAPPASSAPAASPTPTAQPAPAPPAPPAARILAGSYDWHGLLAAPFGSVLKAVPLALHEVLLFREDPAAAVPECYAADSPAPSFAGRMPEEYVLCFKRDRLDRVQASIRLAAAEVGTVFAPACADRLNAAPDAAAAAEDGVACEERDGAIRFSARRCAETERICVTIESAAP